jgi:hypothetical protein
MIKALANKGKTNSMLEFALEISKQYQGKILFDNRAVKRQFDKEKKKTYLKSDHVFNGNLKSGVVRKQFKEDNKENVKMTQQIQVAKKIEFVRENGGFIKFSQWNEKNVRFTSSKLLPKIKLMKVDNDVLTDIEQVDDAQSMMKEHLSKTLDLIKKNSDYLRKTLSKSVRFKKLRK